MVRVGVLGGTFDPVHNGHLAVAETVFHALHLQRILFVPAGEPPHKTSRRITPIAHRVQMVSLAIADRPEFALSLIDVARPGPHYSVDTVRLARQAHQASKDDCFFVTGADALIDLPDWHLPQQLLSLCRLAVAHRPGYQPDIAALSRRLPLLPERIVWVEMPGIPISATAVRAGVKRKQSIAGVVPAAVADYIAAQNLYR